MSIEKDKNMTRFTTEIAEQALEIAMPFIQSIMKEQERKGLFINVGCNISKQIMAQRSIGNKQTDWNAPYDGIADSKVNITFTTNKPSREVQLLYPEMVGGIGDTIYWGSWIDGGIVVAMSGLPPEWDEACAKHICAIVRALLTTQSKQDFVSDKHFT